MGETFCCSESGLHGGSWLAGLCLKSEHLGLRIRLRMVDGLREEKILLLQLSLLRFQQTILLLNSPQLIFPRRFACAKVGELNQQLLPIQVVRGDLRMRHVGSLGEKILYSSNATQRARIHWQ